MPREHARDRIRRRQKQDGKRWVEIGEYARRNGYGFCFQIKDSTEDNNIRSWLAVSFDRGDYLTRKALFGVTQIFMRQSTHAVLTRLRWGNSLRQIV